MRCARASSGVVGISWFKVSDMLGFKGVLVVRPRSAAQILHVIHGPTCLNPKPLAPCSGARGSHAFFVRGPCGSDLHLSVFK